MHHSAAMSSMTQRLAKIQQEMQAISRHALPTLIGASKTQSAETILAAIAAGLHHFGENKIQEAADKWPAIKCAHPQVTLHGIGPIQSNKAADALALFDVIHTVDRKKLVDALCRARDKGAPWDGKMFLVQVNTGEEPQKGGVMPRDLPALLGYCHEAGLPISGLMCVPPVDQPAAPHFALLKKLANRHGLTELSMGMSGDYAEAVRQGATMIRVGTLLFGQRTR
jgi:pyridoxal phosphate enzyme (YggS family)